MISDLTPEEIEALRAFVARALRDVKYPFSPTNLELKAILAKLSPPAPEPTVRPPLPKGKSMVLASRKRAKRG